MNSLNRMSTAPLNVSRSNRNHLVQVLTSMRAGVLAPVAMIPMLREDSLRGRVRVACEMDETAEVLMNPVRFTVSAYLVPWLALERFEGSMDQFNRSYMGKPQVDGGDVIPFFETHARGAAGSNEVYDHLGLHGKSTDLVNTIPLESYNAIWNFLAKNRSRDITLRSRLATTLAPAFWHHSRFAHIVPDFDQAVIDGEVALNVVDSKMPVKGIGKLNSTFAYTGQAVLESVSPSSGGSVTYPKSQLVQPSGSAGQFFVKESEQYAGYPDIWAEMTENGVTVSLSNLELARKTQAYAKLRQQYEGHPQDVDDFLIDMLMSGLSIPDQALKQPILLAQRENVFGQAKRYATDSGNLAESAVNGATFVDLSINVPKLATGGTVMIVAQAVPEQLFERQREPFFYTSAVSQLPDHLRDDLDPEKVEVVKNGQIDTSHATPDATFGYAPLNWQWDQRGVRVGGKFLRPAVDASFDEDRQRLWAVETANPVLSEDFYICTAIHQKPFLNGGTEEAPVDVFEMVAQGNAVLNGNTKFGGVLLEATGNYDKVAEKAPTERLDISE